MFKQRLFVFVILVGACAPPESGAPDPGYCTGAPDAADVDAIYLLTDAGDIIEDGTLTPVVRGGQGTAMSLFRVGLDGPSVPACARVELGGTYIETADLTLTQRPDGMWVSGQLAVLDPTPAYPQSASAYGVSVAREVQLDVGPGGVSGIGVSRSRIGPGESVEVQVTIARATLRESRVGVLLREGSSESASSTGPQVVVPPGETSATLEVTIDRPGEYTLFAQVDGRSEPGEPTAEVVVAFSGGG